MKSVEVMRGAVLPAGALASDIDRARLSWIVELVEGDAPWATEATAALLDEDVFECLGGKVKAHHAIVGEVRSEKILTW